MTKFFRVMDGINSNACGFEYKLDEVDIAKKLNPKASYPDEILSEFEN